MFKMHLKMQLYMHLYLVELPLAALRVFAIILFYTSGPYDFCNSVGLFKGPTIVYWQLTTFKSHDQNFNRMPPASIGMKLINTKQLLLLQLQYIMLWFVYVLFQSRAVFVKT